jgi:hypothetical protein
MNSVPSSTPQSAQSKGCSWLNTALPSQSRRGGRSATAADFTILRNCTSVAAPSVLSEWAVRPFPVANRAASSSKSSSASMGTVALWPFGAFPSAQLRAA